METQPSRFRLLDMLTKEYPPRVNGRVPFWRPPAPKIATEVHEPMWSWRAARRAEPGTRVVHLDANAAYLSAAATVEVAHDRLTRCPRLTFEASRPGYWLIDVGHYRWPLGEQIMSPLGTGHVGERVWLTTPTVALLDQLHTSGHWRDIVVLDAWLGHGCRLRSWTEALRDLRRDIMTTGDAETYDRFKVGYSQAVTTMQVSNRSIIHRPDWASSIRAQHAANVWRKAWYARFAGYPLLGAGSVDELSFTEETLERLAQLVAMGSRAPIRIDPTGVALGAFHVKGWTDADEWNRRRR